MMTRRPAGRFGRFRGWLLAATLGLSAVFGLMACTDITQNFPLLLTCCVLLSAMSAVYGCAMLGCSGCRIQLKKIARFYAHADKLMKKLNQSFFIIVYTF